MRRLATAAVAALALLALAGCSARGGSSTASWDASKFVVLGSEAATVSPSPAMPGLDANSLPQAALRSIPGGGEFEVASGTPAVPRQRAIEVAQPGDGTLVSAVYVMLPASYMRGVLGDSKRAKPTTAWVVTWTGVTQHLRGGAAGTRGQSAAAREFIRHGDTTVIVDATTGTVLTRTEYPTPN